MNDRSSVHLTDDTDRSAENLQDDWSAN